MPQSQIHAIRRGTPREGLVFEGMKWALQRSSSAHCPPFRKPALHLPPAVRSDQSGTDGPSSLDMESEGYLPTTERRPPPPQELRGRNLRPIARGAGCIAGSCG